MELNGWSSPQMLRRFGASARAARAHYTYDRIMDDSCQQPVPIPGALTVTAWRCVPLPPRGTGEAGPKLEEPRKLRESSAVGGGRQGDPRVPRLAISSNWYGGSARGARACRSYDRIMDGTS
jgi:hypothetical protein